MSEAPQNPASLVAIKGLICKELVTINPLAGHQIDTRRPRNKAPGVIGEKGVILGLHSRAPIGVGQSIANRPRQWRHGHSVEVEAIHRLGDASLAARAH